MSGSENRIYHYDAYQCVIICTFPKKHLRGSNQSNYFNHRIIYCGNDGCNESTEDEPSSPLSSSQVLFNQQYRVVSEIDVLIFSQDLFLRIYFSRCDFIFSILGLILDVFRRILLFSAHF